MPNKAIIYDPYLDTLGGGERYCLTIARALLDWGWNVDLAWSNREDVTKAQERFNLDLTDLKVNSGAHRTLSQKSSILDRFRLLSPYDLVFVVSDGSIPVLFGRKKILHYQVPFTSINQNKLINKLKLGFIDKIVVNSKFTQKVIDKTLGVNKSVVLYPPIDTEAFEPVAAKKKQILNVGRFASPSHSKRQDILIKAFKQLQGKNLHGWKLILAGGAKGADTILDSLKLEAKGLPIEFMVNPDFEELRQTYNESMFYWHAAGFEVDEDINPESVEHFGITTVEGMAAGCVPVVIAKGGPKEVVIPGTGYLANSIEQLADLTFDLIKDTDLWTKTATAAVKRSQDFSLEVFTAKLQQIINS